MKKKLRHEESCAHEDCHYIAASLAGMGGSFRNSIMREGASRLDCAIRMAHLLEDSLFYVRMYQDRCLEGRERRERMIDEAVELIAKFRGGVE